MFAHAEKQQIQPVPKQEILGQNPTRRNDTGIPAQMKENFESLTGYSFDDVRVHYNSDRPGRIQALAYTQGNRVYIAPGQERHLGHELGHVVQQKRGWVQPTGRIQDVEINDSPAMEMEADAISGRAAGTSNHALVQLKPTLARGYAVQMVKSAIPELPEGTRKPLTKGGPPEIHPWRMGYMDRCTVHHIINFASGLEPWFGDMAGKYDAIVDHKKKLDEEGKKRSRPEGIDTAQTNANKIFLYIKNALVLFGCKKDSLSAPQQAEYSWRPGNLFVGVLVNYRKDDPERGHEFNKSTPKNVNLNNRFNEQKRLFEKMNEMKTATADIWKKYKRNKTEDIAIPSTDIPAISYRDIYYTDETVPEIAADMSGYINRELAQNTPLIAGMTVINFMRDRYNAASTRIHAAIDPIDVVYPTAAPPNQPSVDAVKKENIIAAYNQMVASWNAAGIALSGADAAAAAAADAATAAQVRQAAVTTVSGCLADIELQLKTANNNLSMLTASLARDAANAGAAAASADVTEALRVSIPAYEAAAAANSHFAAMSDNLTPEQITRSRNPEQIVRDTVHTRLNSKSIVLGNQIAGTVVGFKGEPSRKLKENKDWKADTSPGEYMGMNAKIYSLIT